MNRKRYQLKYYLPMLLLQLGFYGVRLWWWHYNYHEFRIRPPLVLVQKIFSLIPFGIMTLLVGIILTITVLLSMKWSKSTYPSKFLLIGIFITALLPLPAIPPIPETSHFLEYRADYEHVLDLAREGKLDDSSTNACKHPPLTYQHLSGAGCINIYKHNGGLSAMFNPIESHSYPVVYVESDAPNNPCPGNYYVEEKIADHWYLCFEDWN